MTKKLSVYGRIIIQNFIILFLFYAPHSWPEFLMLLEKGANLNPELNKTPTKKSPSSVYKPQLSQKKPPSPKSSLHLTSNDTKSKESKETGRTGGKPRPKSSSVPTQDSKPKDSSDTSDVKSIDKQVMSKSTQVVKLKEGKDLLKAADRTTVKLSDPLGPKVKSKDQKDSGKPKVAEEVKKDEGKFKKY